MPYSSEYLGFDDLSFHHVENCLYVMALHFSFLDNTVAVLMKKKYVCMIHVQCSAEKFHNWGQCPRALEKVGTFEKKVGTLREK